MKWLKITGLCLISSAIAIWLILTFMHDLSQTELILKFPVPYMGCVILVGIGAFLFIWKDW